MSFENVLHIEINNHTVKQFQLLHFNRCKCGNCQIMDTTKECICCQEIDALVNKNLELVIEGTVQQVPCCITQHPGFLAVCTNKWVLETAKYRYRQQYTDAYHGPEHRENRHVAYRQLAR